MKSVKRAYSAPELRQNGSKKPKADALQTNTLLNYFQSKQQSDGVVVKKELKTHLSLTSFFADAKNYHVKSEPKLELSIVDENENEIDDSVLVTAEIKTQQVLKGKNAFDILLRKGNDNEKANLKNDENLAQQPPSSIRKCPFYKRIEGTQITVDAFNYGDVENCNVYFLSHFHYDHYVGLSRHFRNRLVCSKVTANLVSQKIRVESKYVRGLDLNEFVNVYDNDDSIQVALIDANHCPGSVMFLFRLKHTGKYVLHTGDFRASDELIKNAFFQGIKIDTIHLDTTYLDSFYKFQPQSKVILAGVDLVLNELSKQPKTLILCGSYTIGKERIFIAIAEALGIKVCVSKDKMNTLSCLKDKTLDQMLTLDPHETNLHVVSMAMLNIKDLDTYLNRFPRYQNLIAIRPTGWTHKEYNNNLKSNESVVSIEKQWKNIVIYGIEYSEHSSFDELKNCITTWRPKRIIPHVNVARKDQRDKMQAYFDEWLKSY